MRYKTSTEYWLDPENMTLRGKFDEMYQDLEDPWDCLGKSTKKHKRLLCELLSNDRGYGSILDVGCGLGGFTKIMSDRNGSARVVGCDISETAIGKARNLYPSLRFEVKNVLSDDFADLESPFDLIVVSEVLWYVLDDLGGVFEKLSRALASSGVLALQQYFPDNQQFGRQVIDGLGGFESFVRNGTDLKMTEKVVCFEQNDGVVLLASLQKK